jgi:hypothetical protein
MNHSAAGGEIAMALMVGLMLFTAVVLYFLPTFVAGVRGHQNTVPIFVLNLFLGFTGAGWIVALVWALTQVSYPYGSEPRCSRARAGGAKAIVGALTVAAICLGVVGAGIAGISSGHSSSHQAPRVASKSVVPANRANLPAEAKIQALKQEVANLSPAIDKQRAAVAKETAEVTNWTKEVAVKKAQLHEDEENLTAMRQAIKEQKDFKTRDGDRIPSNALEQHFARKFEEYKAVKQATTGAEETLTRHRERRDLAQQNYRDLESKQQELRARVETLELELAKLREADLKDEIIVDDRKAADVNRLVDDIETRIAEQKKEQDLRKGDALDRDIENTLKDKARSKDALKEWDESNKKK